MYCENYFCIYHDKEKCTLNEVTLDIQGCCQECIYVMISEKTLKKEREKFLKRYQYQDGE